MIKIVPLMPVVPSKGLYFYNLKTIFQGLLQGLKIKKLYCKKFNYLVLQAGGHQEEKQTPPQGRHGRCLM